MACITYFFKKSSMYKMSFGRSIVKLVRSNAAYKSSVCMPLTEKRCLSSLASIKCRLPQVNSKTRHQRSLHLTHGTHNQTDGDKDLVSFLQEEINYEQENVMEVPEFKDFKVEMNGTHVGLSRKFNGEKVEISFDVNENLNVDEEISVENPEEIDVDTPDIVSYPQFTVKITKPSGKTLHFNCSCNTNLSEEDLEGETAEDEQFDLFRFENVKIYDKTSQNESVFEADTETMDGELYSMLMTTLLERGVNGVFINDLIDLSTSVEHRHYLTFLKTLQSFMAGK